MKNNNIVQIAVFRENKEKAIPSLYNIIYMKARL